MATIFDPTMGEGNLIEGLITFGIQSGINPNALPFQNLFGVELNPRYLETFLEKSKKLYNIDFPAGNFVNSDIFFWREEKPFDIVFGNPPWQNFVDLPEQYKKQIKSEFLKYDLVDNTQTLLLGGSRIDIAALVVQKVVERNLKPNGEAVFFIPLSLLLNDGANKLFRTYKIHSISYCIDRVFDFNHQRIFPNVATRYGLCHIVRNKKQMFPVHYALREKDEWTELFAKPLLHNTDPLSILPTPESNPLSDFVPISLKRESTPRQGINTCGANDVFFFDHCEMIDLDYCIVSNNVASGARLPRAFIYPLLSSSNFGRQVADPQRWVLLPYNPNGKPLALSQLNEQPSLLDYLSTQRNILVNRKGTLIQAWIKRGFWWSLLGVGAYNFFPYKIVWEAYGRSEFRPALFDGHWQVNQSLQAYIPLKSQSDGTRILRQLLDTCIQEYLISLNMKGTMNWAQPGKIRKLISFEDEASPSLFALTSQKLVLE